MKKQKIKNLALILGGCAGIAGCVVGGVALSQQQKLQTEVKEANSLKPYLWAHVKETKLNNYNQAFPAHIIYFDNWNNYKEPIYTSEFRAWDENQKPIYSHVAYAYIQRGSSRYTEEIPLNDANFYSLLKGYQIYGL